MGNILVADGDSITLGFQDSGPSDPYTNLLNLSLGPWFIANVSVSGETMATMLANAPTVVDPFYGPTGSGNCVVIWGGSNDIIEGDAAVSVYANLTAYIAARHEVGWKVITCTMLSRVGGDIEKNIYNALILANSAGADAVVDFSTTPLGVDGGYENLIYFQSDQIHPTEFSISTIETPKIQAAINALNIQNSQPISLLQSFGEDADGSSGIAETTFPDSVNAGDLLLVSITPFTAGVTIVDFSDSLGSSWTSQAIGTPSGFNAYIFTAKAKSSGPCTIKAVLSGVSDDVYTTIASWTGVGNLDGLNSNTQGFQDPPNTVGVVTDVSPALLISVADFYYGTNAVADGHSEAIEWGSPIDGFHSIGYTIVSVKGSQMGVWAYGGESYSFATLLAFKSGNSPTKFSVYPGAYSGETLKSAFTNPQQLDLIQVVNEGGDVVWSLDYGGTAFFNPIQFSTNAIIGKFFGDSFQSAFINPLELDVFQVVSSGSSVIFRVDYLGQAHNL